MRLNGNKKNKTMLIMGVGDGGKDELTNTRPQLFIVS